MRKEEAPNDAAMAMQIECNAENFSNDGGELSIVV